MIGLYSEVWQEIPFSWRLAASAASVALLGYSISPFSVASLLVFRLDQEGACQQRFVNELLSSRHGQGSYSIDSAKSSWSNCSQAIPLHPGLIDEYKAIQNGNTILFSKETK